MSSDVICWSKDSGMIDCGTTVICLMSPRFTVVLCPGPCRNVMLVGDWSPMMPTIGSPETCSTW